VDVKFNVRDSIKKPSQLTIDTGLKVLVYGAAGAGNVGGGKGAAVPLPYRALVEIAT
jgi:hypothetical protein